MNFNGKSYSASGGNKGSNTYHNRSTGVISYNGMQYDKMKSTRNRAFMSSFENEFNRGFRPKWGSNNTMNKFQAKSGQMAPRRPNSEFKNWNNSLSRTFRPNFQMMYRKIVFNTIQATH